MTRHTVARPRCASTLFSKMLKRFILTAAVTSAFGIGPTAAELSEPRLPLAIEAGGLPDFFDCVRDNGILISAHRGGPVPGYPENAIETFANTLEQTPAILEIDVDTSKDGTLWLMHDRTLDRTSTGQGPLSALSDTEIAKLRLRDNDGVLTDFKLPTLTEALSYARDRTILVLDRKDPTTYDAIIDAVEIAAAEDYVIVSTYALEDAVAVHKRNPALMIGASIEDLRALEAIEDAGVELTRVLAWTGIIEHRPWLYPRLADRGVESMFGTIGTWPQSFDNLVKARNDDSLYEWLTAGIQVIATDRAFAVSRALPGVMTAAEACSAR